MKACRLVSVLRALYCLEENIMRLLVRQLLALTLRHSFSSILVCVVAMNMLSWQGASASALSTQQAQPASFTLRPAKGNCTPVVGCGAHFPPGSTVNI